jgi:hypothetical protein
MTPSEFELIHQGRGCRVVTQRSTSNRLRGAAYVVVLVNYADGGLGEWLPAGQFFRAAKYAACGHTVSRCRCEAEPDCPSYGVIPASQIVRED